MPEQPKDIESLFDDVYSRIVPKHFGYLHGFLLNSLESHLIKNPNGTLLVLGPGGNVLPYSRQYTEDGNLGQSNRDRIKGMIGNGRIILSDYVLKFDESGLEKERDVLSRMGFFDNGYFDVGTFNPKEILHPISVGEGTISFLLNNLKDNLRVADGTIAAVDATQSFHYASVTRRELERVCGEVYRVLRPGGLFHVAEGDIDMSYHEDKLIRIGQDFASLTGLCVLISDERDKSHVIRAFFEHGEEYEDFVGISEENLPPHKKYIRLTVDAHGHVILENTRETILPPEKYAEIDKGLKKKGYKSVWLSYGSIALPLIDPEMPEDVEKYIKPVRNYIDAVQKRIETLYAGNEELIAAMGEKNNFVKGNELRALVDHRTGRERMAKTLQKVGFRNIGVHKPEGALSYTILAYKPK